MSCGHMLCTYACTTAHGTAHVATPCCKSNPLGHMLHPSLLVHVSHACVLWRNMLVCVLHCIYTVMHGHAALSQIDPAAHNFKVLLRHVVSRVMDAIPSKLLDQELGIKSAPGQNEEVGPEPQPAEAMQGEQAQQAERAQQDAEHTATQQAADPQHAKHDGGNDGDFAEEEEGRVRLPLFTNKVMTLVQDLLQYKVRTCL